MTTYIALFEYEYESEKQGFRVVFPDFSGLVTEGYTYEETLRLAHDILIGHIEAQRCGEKDVPNPSTIEAIQENWAEWNKWKENCSFFVVPITIFSQSKKTKLISIEISESLLERIDAVTSNRSEFINSALEYSFEKKRAERCAET